MANCSRHFAILDFVFVAVIEPRVRPQPGICFEALCAFGAGVGAGSTFLTVAGLSDMFFKEVHLLAASVAGIAAETGWCHY